MAESFYTDTDLIGSGEFLDGSTLSLSTRMTFAVAGTITAIRWHFPAVAPSGTVGVRVYPDAGGAALATGSFSSPTLDTWNTVAVSVAVSAGQTLRPTIVTPGRYVAKASFYTSSITRGNITGINGYFTTGDGFPSGASGNQSAYFVDVVFESSAGGTTHDASASGAATSSGSAAVVLTLAAVASGAALSAGSAAATARLAAACTAAATSAGSAAVSMMLAAAASGGSSSGGFANPGSGAPAVKAGSVATVGAGRTSTAVLSARYQSTPEVTRG